MQREGLLLHRLVMQEEVQSLDIYHLYLLEVIVVTVFRFMDSPCK